MSEYAGRPTLPGYVSIKEAAHLLGLSDKRVYEYVDEGRLPSMWAADVIMIPLEEVRRFKRRGARVKVFLRGAFLRERTLSLSPLLRPSSIPASRRR